MENPSPSGLTQTDDLAAQVGKNIRRIRCLKHIKQGELARLVGIQPGPMNMIERGRHVPSGRVLFQLAQALKVPIDAFFPSFFPLGTHESQETNGEDVPSSHLAINITSSRGLSSSEGLSALDQGVLLDLMDAYLVLEDMCGAFKKTSLPLDLPFESTDIGLQQLADRVRQALGISQAIVLDYLELFENTGLRVIFCALSDDIESWSFADRPNANAFFFVRSGMNVERQLFCLLYELGRIYLWNRWHGSAGRGCDDKTSFDERVMDHAARKFAALFLMPEFAVRATVSQLGISADGWSYELILRIKHRFGVSAESFTIRLQELNLITDELAEEFKKRIRKHYKETGFAEPDLSRRILSPNGRLGDLMVTATRKSPLDKDVTAIRDLLQQKGVAWE